MVNQSYSFLADDGREQLPVLSIDPVESLAQPVNTQKVISQPVIKKTGIKTRYLIADWKASRNRIPLSGASRTAAQTIAGTAAIGGTIGSAIPILGTGVGTAVGAAIGGIKELFGGNKDKRLVQHLEEFYIELVSQSFGSGSYQIGLNASDGNGKNAARITKQFPQSEMESFLISAGQQFLRSAESLQGITTYDRETLRTTAETLKFSDSIPGRGTAAVYLSYKVDPNIASQQQQPEVVSVSKENQQKITAGVGLAVVLLSFLK